MKVWQILLILWVVVFAFWLYGQFRRASREDDRRLMEQWAREGGPTPPPVRYPD
jgi:uncharacterized membrane protein YsdA (DUF1294 family)